jgi:hypothetical protein
MRNLALASAILLGPTNVMAQIGPDNIKRQDGDPPSFTAAAPTVDTTAPAKTYLPGWIANATLALAPNTCCGGFSDYGPAVASFVVQTLEPDIYARVTKYGDGADALILKGSFNIAEEGYYGFATNISISRSNIMACSARLTIDGGTVFQKGMSSFQFIYSQTISGSVSLGTGTHPAQLEFFCVSGDGRKKTFEADRKAVQISFKVKMPSEEALIAPPHNFVLHEKRKSDE